MAELDQFFRGRPGVEAIVNRITELVNGPVSIMEVCGTHTMSIFRHGLRALLPKEINLVSGPGCPVCVTSQQDIDRMICLADMDDVIVATFGDLLRVPGSNGSLADARARGAKVQVVYSPADALKLAQSQKGEHVIFLGIGFETTAPTVAATILQAHNLKLSNFSVYSSHKVMPPALHALFEDEGLSVHGLLCPGHVSSIIGTKAYEPICERFGLPCVVAGFEPLDILAGILLILRQIRDGKAIVENAYTRAVSDQGNRRALAIMEQVFETRPARWRGLGTIDKSGLGIRDEFSMFDAERRFDIKTPEVKEHRGCICGEIIRAKALPPQCPMFAKKCTPTSPIGPCMVSSEGTCSAYYRYAGHE